MNQWMNDNSPSMNGHVTIGQATDPSMSFGQPPQTINPAQFQNQPYLNGHGRTTSPAFHNPMYQTNSVIPSKRTREDSLGTSPRQTHNAPPGSRSQTPGQGIYPNFNPQSNGAPPFTSAPSFQHLQTSNNATPSPTMTQMGYPTQNVNQRVSTASPSPFSPQHNIPNASPGPSEHASRVGTPHDNPQQFAPNSQFNPGFNQQFPNNMQGQMAMNQMNMATSQMNMNQLNPAQRYQMQLQQQARQMAATQARNANGMQMPGQGPMANQQTGQHEQGGAAPPRLSINPQEFFKSLTQFYAAKGRPIDLQPQICGRNIDILRLHAAITKYGGSVRISKMNQWAMIAQLLQFQPPQQGQAAMELQQWWMKTVGPFEQMWMQNQQRRLMQQQQNQMPNQSPQRDGQQMPQINNHQRSQSDVMQMQLNGQAQNQAQQNVNGFTQQPKDQQDGMLGHQRSSLSRQLDLSDLNGIQSQPDQTAKRPQTASVKAEAEPELSMPRQEAIHDPFVPEILRPGPYHGPINVEEMFTVGQTIADSKPIAPGVRELGVIDIHALTMAVKSGMHGETRNALDTLISISSEPSLQLHLEMCDDLMETLVDCAQVEVDFLAEHASEVTDEVSLSSYEEMTRACHVEAKVLHDVPEFGSLPYDLDRAADRLICITTLIRNFSFYEPNFTTLGQPEVIQLITRVIQQIGTKDMPLRTHRNTLDFMKDVIIYLSNLSYVLHLPSKQDALCLLHFLLCFAPSPSPSAAQTANPDAKLAFAPYTPNIHKYLPPAVDSIAKLLARDEPNRAYYRAIFAADAHSSPPYDLLTRTFGLVVAPIAQTSAHLRQLIETRKPFLLQGLLAAEILASLAPGSEHPLARSWLMSDDCFAGNLLKIASVLSSTPQQPQPPRHPPNPRHPHQQHHDPDPQAYGSIVSRCMSILKSLGSKARTVDGEGNNSLPFAVAMRKESLLGAMIQKDVDRETLRMLCSYAGLED